jgi:hypothetical protein
MSEMKALVDAVDALTSRKRELDASYFSADAFAAPAPVKRGRKTKNADLTREQRLQQNRQAASESRRRKKEMVDELQRSVAFFTKANVSLKSQNAELERQLLLAKQRVLAAEQGLPVPPVATANVASASKKPSSELMGFLKSSPVDEQAQAAHFAATQAMYKSMGFPPSAARAAASTFSQYVGQTGTVVGSGSTSPVEKSEGLAKDPFVGLKSSPSANNEQAQAAHFAATQALYKSMGFPPRAAKAAASTFSHCPQTRAASKPAANAAPVAQLKSPQPAQPLVQPSSGESYVEALNKFALQQAAIARSAAAAADAAMKAAQYQTQTQQYQAPLIASAPFVGLNGVIGGVSISDLLLQAQAQKKE